MVISRMVSPHATHRGKAAGSGGLSIGGGLLQPRRTRRLSTSDHSPRVFLRTGWPRRPLDPGDEIMSHLLFLLERTSFVPPATGNSLTE